MGDLNGRVGKSARNWPDVIERHGVGTMSADVLRLLTLCTEINLCITNTLFLLKNKHYTSWLHPRSLNWHHRPQTCYYSPVHSCMNLEVSKGNAKLIGKP